MRYGICLFPSKELQEHVNSYRKRYDTHYALIKPHITLKEPFEMGDEDVSSIVGRLEKVGEESKPIPIVVDKVRSFHPINNVIFLRVNDHSAIAELHQRLHHPGFPDTKSYHFVPHITIAQDLSDVEHADIYERLKMIHFYHEETIHSFSLLNQDVGGTWKTIRTFDLGGK